MKTHSFGWLSAAPRQVRCLITYFQFPERRKKNVGLKCALKVNAQSQNIDQKVFFLWLKCYVVDPQIDLETIKDMYLEKYDVTLKEALDSECGGDFKRLLIEILHWSFSPSSYRPHLTNVKQCFLSHSSSSYLYSYSFPLWTSFWQSVLIAAWTKNQLIRILYIVLLMIN